MDIKIFIFFIAVILYCSLPLFWQGWLGSKAIKKTTKLKFWQITLISFLSIIAFYFLNTFIMKYKINQSTAIHEGLPFLFINLLYSFLSIVLIIETLIQAIIIYRKKHRGNS